MFRTDEDIARFVALIVCPFLIGALVAGLTAYAMWR
jgi:hypothetical protein